MTTRGKGRLSRTLREGFAELGEHRQAFVGLCLLAGLVMLSYGLARPAVESMFLTAYGKERLPELWLVVAGTAALVVAIYNQFAARVGVSQLYVGAALIACAVLTIGQVVRMSGHTGGVFFLAVWQDVYIVVLVELFWSIANLLYKLKGAKIAYGFFCASGSIGSIAAEISQTWLARSLGTPNTLWFIIPALLTSAVIATRIAGHHSLPKRAGQGRHQSSVLEGLRTVANSRYLVPLLILIGIVQVVITLVDYQFKGMMLELYPDEDVRTGMIGTVYAIINVVAFGFQVSSALILSWLGVALVLVGIPLILGGAVTAFAVAPGHATMAVAKVGSKAFDYSLFRAAKEILYLPLSYSEKTQGKAFVDMLTYRAAKAGAALLLFYLTAAGYGGAEVNLVTLALLVGWIGLVTVVVRRYLLTLEEAPPEG